MKKWFHLKYNPSIVLVDEGYASYVSKENWKQLRKELRKEDAKEADSTLLYSISSNIFRSVDHLFRDLIRDPCPLKKGFFSSWIPVENQ